MVKSYRLGGWVHVIIVASPVPWIWVGGVWDKGLTTFIIIINYYRLWFVCKRVIKYFRNLSSSKESTFVIESSLVINSHHDVHIWSSYNNSQLRNTVEQLFTKNFCIKWKKILRIRKLAKWKVHFLLTLYREFQSLALKSQFLGSNGKFSLYSLSRIPDIRV